MTIALSLATTWTPSADSQELAYGIELTNHGDTPVGGFQLAFSGPACIDPTATLENGRLLRRLSNHTLMRRPKPSCWRPAKPGARWPAACPMA
ncbi:MAG: hypothetical protein MO852_03360, partial [Candidatus Devosia euplotis]|nr:hypothetical protein [Candidatus Devosia euplotis]